MSGAAIEKFFCNTCKGRTKHFIRGEHKKTEDSSEGMVSLTERYLIIECCGCEGLALVRKTFFSEDIEYGYDPFTGEETSEPIWKETIYPPVSYRNRPDWYADIPDQTLRDISDEIYTALQTDLRYLATFGSRTLIDRLIVLTVGDQGTFTKGMEALVSAGKMSVHEWDILDQVIDAGHAAAHRGWAPDESQLKTILDTVEGLIHRLLVLPKLAEELEDSVPARNGKAKPPQKGSVPPANNQLPKPPATFQQKLDAASKELRALYDSLSEALKLTGSGIAISPQKHYIAFRRGRNFACVQIFNQKKEVRVFLNLDPDEITPTDNMRDVRRIGHFGTGDVEVTLRTIKDVEALKPLIQASYDNS